MQFEPAKANSHNFNHDKIMSNNKENTETPNFQVGDLVYWTGDKSMSEDKVMTIKSINEGEETAVCRFRNSKGDFETAEFNFDELAIS